MEVVALGCEEVEVCRGAGLVALPRDLRGEIARFALALGRARLLDAANDRLVRVVDAVLGLPARAVLSRLGRRCLLVRRRAPRDDARVESPRRGQCDRVIGRSAEADRVRHALGAGGRDRRPERGARGARGALGGERVCVARAYGGERARVDVPRLERAFVLEIVVQQARRPASGSCLLAVASAARRAMRSVYSASAMSCFVRSSSLDDRL